MSVRVLHKIAAGGTATVYAADRGRADGEIVAVKRPHPHLFDDARFLESLRREAKLAARARHPNLVRTVELAEEAGEVEIVMEYVDGVSLAELVASWPEAMSANDRAAAAAHVVAELCDGLEAIHSLADDLGEPLRLVHRDVSPQNVLVADDGHAKVTDFGLVRSIATGDRSTTDGVLKGKAGYLAPEYVRGAPIDQRIDVFAAGVVLWEAIAKRRLFQGENEADTLQRILRCEVPKLAAELTTGGAEIDAILAEALARGPADRFGTAAELGTALREWLASFATGTTAATVRATFGASALRLLEDRRAAIAAARRSTPAPTSRKRVLVAALALACLGVAVLTHGTSAGSAAPPTAASTSPVDPRPSTSTSTSTSTPPPPEIELVDVPAPSSSAARAASSSRRVLPSHAQGSSPGGTTPPEPRPNPYRGPR